MHRGEGTQSHPSFPPLQPSRHMISTVVVEEVFRFDFSTLSPNETITAVQRSPSESINDDSEGVRKL